MELLADLFITVDGFAKGERSPAYFGFRGPELERWIHDELAKPQTILLGRVTYELLSAMAGGEQATRMDELPKLVVSSTLPEPLGWNARLLDSIERVRELKAQQGPPLRCMGSLSLVRTLMAQGLLDRLRLVVFPLILGESGREPFLAGLPDIDLELVGQRVLDGRLVLLDSIERVRELKARPGPPLRCMGSLSLVRTLMAQGLLDRLRLVVFPLILGESGREPFLAGLPDIDLELAGQRVLDGRLVLLDYRPLTPSV